MPAVGVIPRKTRARVFAPHGFHIYDERAVQVGTKTATALIADPRDLVIYDALFQELEMLAVYGEAVRALLEQVANDYRRLT